MGLGIMSKLSLHGTDFKSAPGGVTDLDWSDVAAALAYGLSPGAEHLGLYLFAGHEDSRNIILRLLTVVISKAYETEMRGEAMPSKTALGLAESVVVELSDRRRCKRCAGSGTVFVKVQRSEPAKAGTTKSLTACPKCGGVGVESMSTYQQARLAGLNSMTMTRRYLNARASGCRAYSAWLTELRDHLNAQFQSDDNTEDQTSH